MKFMVIQVIHILVWIMKYGFVIQTMLIHINMIWNKIHGIVHELIGYALALVELKQKGLVWGWISSTEPNMSSEWLTLSDFS